MTTFDTRLIPPEDSEDTRRLFRAVWWPALRELGFLAVFSLGLYFVGVQVDPEQRMGTSALIALLPVLLWGLFSLRPERQVQFPRTPLLRVFVLSVLVGGAVTAPFIDMFIEPSVWLTQQSGLNRMIGTMLTVGMVTELSKYLVLRYTIWPGYILRRVDAVAYVLAASLGMAVVFNLRFALLEGGAQPGAAMIHVTSVSLMQQAVSLPLAMAFIRMKHDRLRNLEPAAFLLLSAFLQGFFVMFRTGMVVRGFGIGGDGSAPLFGLIYAVGFALVIYTIFAFLLTAADDRERRSTGRTTRRYAERSGDIS